MCIICQGVAIGASLVASLIPGVASEQPRRVETPVAAQVSAGVAPGISGKSCRKSGVVRSVGQVSYRCSPTKSGLRWKTQSAPVTTTTPPTTTTTMAVPSDSVAKKVYESVVGAMSQEVASSTQIEYISEEPSNTVGEDAAKRGVAPALRLFAQLGFNLPNSVIVMFAKTETGVRSTLIGQGCDSALLRTNSFEYLRSTGVAVGGSCGNGRVATVAGPVARWSRDQASIDFQHTIPHELFHTWQMKDSGMCGQWRCGSNDFPVWLWEGTPQFMTRLAFWSWNRQKTHDQWFDHWYRVQRTDQFSMCKGVTIEQMVQPSPAWPSPGACAYSKGQLAIEVLVANYGGFDALKRLHTTKSTPGYLSFETHFRSATGRELSDFYSEVNLYFKTRGWD